MGKRQAKALTAKAGFAQHKLRQEQRERGFITKKEAEVRAAHAASDIKGLMALLKLWHF